VTFIHYSGHTYKFQLPINAQKFTDIWPLGTDRRVYGGYGKIYELSELKKGKKYYVGHLPPKATKLHHDVKPETNTAPLTAHNLAQLAPVKHEFVQPSVQSFNQSYPPSYQPSNFTGV